MEKLHNNHLRLVAELRTNSREKLTSISKRTHIPISTLFDMLKDLQDGLITKSTVLIDFSQLGYHTRSKILLKVSQENKEALQKHLFCNDAVNNIYKVNGGWSFMIETIHKNNKELDKFVENLQDNFTIDYQMHYLIDEVKREGFVVN